MTNSKSTKRALLSSAFAMLVCVAMLIGTTFAWFTDTASTGVNKIQAGTLDVDIQTEGGKSLDGVTMEFATDGKDVNKLWEPGATRQLTPFKIVNNGNLALKFKVILNGFVGDAKLLEAIDFTFKTEMTFYEDVSGGNGHYGYVTREVELPLANLSESEGMIIYAKGTTYGNALDWRGETPLITIVAHMKETAGNEYQGLSLEGLGITVVATQATAEHDYNGNDYDAEAEYPVADAAGLTEAVKAGGIVTVGKDIDPGVAVVADGSMVYLDMNGKTIANTKDIWDGQPNDWSLVSARNGADLTISGNGTFKAKENDCYAVDIQDGSTVTIKDGTFIGNIHAVYVEEGTAIIEGGFYSVQQKYPAAGKENEFVLNCYDANRANGTAKIVVKGGTFVNFNPADCAAEGAGTNFVANGYKVVSETQTNGDIWYTVVAE